MKTSDEKMNQIGELIRRELDATYWKEPYSSLVLVCEKVELHLQQLAYQLVLKELNDYSVESGVYFTTSPSEYFTYNGVIYQLKITEYPTDNRILSLTIKNTEPESTNFIRKATVAKFDSLGRYGEIRVTTDEVFLKTQTSLAETIQYVFESGYRWLSEYVRLSLDNIRTETTIEVYSHIRRVLPEPLVNKVWLYAIIDKNGIYIPDTIAFNAALKFASERKFAFRESPLELVADFSTRLTEFEKIFSKIAITENRSVFGTVATAGYAGSGIELAEKAIYQSDQFVIQPLVREGKTLLTASYPSDIAPYVEGVLEKEKENIRLIIASKETAFRDSIRKIKEHGFLPKLEPKLFEYAGAFLRGLLDLPG